jgi:dolichol-phosphate mannosyltransferase
LIKLLRLALDGIFNFSTAPLAWVFMVGIVMACLTFFGLFIVLLQRAFDFPIFGVHPSEVPGFALTTLIILFIGGVQMTCIGILGEYIARIYQEVKGRPSYIVVQQELGETGRKSVIVANEKSPVN